MYRISNIKRKYSPTPIVRVEIGENGKEKEVYVCCSLLSKKEGDKFSEEIVEFLNKKHEKIL